MDYIYGKTVERLRRKAIGPLTWQPVALIIEECWDTIDLSIVFFRVYREYGDYKKIREGNNGAGVI